MKMKAAVTAIAVGTVVLSSAGFLGSALQENVITCETQLNLRQLEIINTLQRQSSNRVMAAQFAIQMQIERATGVRGPLPSQFQNVIFAGQQSESRMLTMLESAMQQIERGCNDQRSEWYLFSLFVILLNGAMAGAAFWLGLRASYGEKADPQEMQA